jgi:hypothetical protein
MRLRNSPHNKLEPNGGGGEDASGDLTVNPVKNDVSDGRRRPDYDDAPVDDDPAPADTRHNGHIGQGDAGSGIPNGLTPTLE